MVQPAPRAQVRLGGTTVTYLPDGHGRLNPAALFPARAPDGWATHAEFLDSDGRLPVSVGSFHVRTADHTILVHGLDLGRGGFAVPGASKIYVAV